ncbi:MAG: septum formation protein Maf [Caldithrix sp.]|nr:septum formation protein Maf [Caldithrix sp.]
MLCSLINNLEKIDVILASSSPRRYELLQSIGLDFRVIPGNVDEYVSTERHPSDLALYNAENKGELIARNHPGGLVISADTVVSLNQQIMGKPQDESAAYQMLRALSGQTHQVITAFWLIFKRYDKRVHQYVETSVTFRDLTDDEIWAYINTGEPFDKAGGYGIQGQGALLVKRIEGCYSNVVGFPLSRFFITLNDFLSGLAIE